MSAGSVGPLLHSEVTGAIIGAAMEVRKALGPGLLESAYESCLAHELLSQRMQVARQVELPVTYKGQFIETGYRLDLVVESCVIVEIKAVVKLDPIHEAQLLTYLKLSGMRVGLLINFNAHRLMEGIVRRVL